MPERKLYSARRNSQRLRQKFRASQITVIVSPRSKEQDRIPPRVAAFRFAQEADVPPWRMESSERGRRERTESHERLCLRHVDRIFDDQQLDTLNATRSRARARAS